MKSTSPVISLMKQKSFQLIYAKKSYNMAY